MRDKSITEAAREFHLALQDFIDEVSEFKVEDPDLLEFIRQRPYYEEGDESAPFFSEAFLYNLMGKEDARTILAFMRELAKLTGAYRSDTTIRRLF